MVSKSTLEAASAQITEKKALMYSKNFGPGSTNLGMLLQRSALGICEHGPLHVGKASFPFRGVTALKIFTWKVREFGGSSPSLGNHEKTRKKPENLGAPKPGNPRQN